MIRVGVLASGSGSNFQALTERLNVPGSAVKVELLLCNVAGAKCLERAAALGVTCEVLEHTAFVGSREAFDEAMVAALKRHQIDLVCLAGYMRLVTPVFLKSFAGKVVNVHPALLPSFPGLHGPRQALAKGVKIAGCTVHFVDEGTDTGPIIAQAAVPVLPGDDEAALAGRILVEEHRLFAKVVSALAQGQVRLEGGRAIVTEVLS